MAARWEQITELFKQTVQEVTSTPSSWRAFLTSACRNYRLPFDEQLLIYAQRPDATAVLELDRWNQRFGRWVNRGARGIAVFDPECPHRLRYYFDVADTHETRMSRPVPLWQVRPEYEQDVVETLENSIGELEHREDLGDALLSTARNAVEDNMGDYLEELSHRCNGFKRIHIREFLYASFRCWKTKRKTVHFTFVLFSSNADKCRKHFERQRI